MTADSLEANEARYCLEQSFGNLIDFRRIYDKWPDSIEFGLSLALQLGITKKLVTGIATQFIQCLYRSQRLSLFLNQLNYTNIFQLELFSITTFYNFFFFITKLNKAHRKTTKSYHITTQKI